MKTNFSVRAFFLEPTDQVELSLRRYRLSEGKCSVSRHGYCDVTVVLEQLSLQALDARGWPMREGKPVSDGRAIARTDSRWPARCGCGYEFQENDQWCADPDPLYRRSDTGELITLEAAPAGAMWFAPWFSDHHEYTGPDGNTLVVRCPPGHDWIVDSRASNCDSPCEKCGVPYNKHGHTHDEKRCDYVDGKPHKCWVRTGTPPNVTAGKTGGPTCGAGAGSIKTPLFHGFLRAGVLSGQLDTPKTAPAPAEPSPYVRVSGILKKADGLSAAQISEAFLRDTGKPLQQSALEFALKKGRTKGTFVEVAGVWRHFES